MRILFHSYFKRNIKAFKIATIFAELFTLIILQAFELLLIPLLSVFFYVAYEKFRGFGIRLFFLIKLGIFTVILVMLLYKLLFDIIMFLGSKIQIKDFFLLFKCMMQTFSCFVSFLFQLEGLRLSKRHSRSNYEEKDWKDIPEANTGNTSTTLHRPILRYKTLERSIHSGRSRMGMPNRSKLYRSQVSSKSSQNDSINLSVINIFKD